MKLENKRKRDFGKLSLIIQIISTFLLMFTIAIFIVLAIVPGQFNAKLNDLYQYTITTLGFASKEPQIEDNSILPKTKKETVSNKPEEIKEEKPNPSISTGIQIPNQTEKPNPQVNQQPTQTGLVYPAGIPELSYTFYYNQLNPTAKIIYDKLRQESAYFLNGKHVFNYGTIFNDLLNTENGENELHFAFQSAVNTLVLDYPQLFFIDVKNIGLAIKTVRYPGLPPVYSVEISNIDNKLFYADGLNTKEDVENTRIQVEARRNNFIQLAKQNAKTDYDFIKNVHDLIINHVEYDDTGNDNKKYNLCTALLEGKAVCEGYAKLFKYIMDGAGIPAVTVVGNGINSKGQLEPHAWNQVYINGAWYGIDTTWDDPIIVGGGKLSESLRYRYFLVGELEFKGNHEPTGNVSPGVYFNSLPLPPRKFRP